MSKPNYWCVVALDYARDQAWIVAMSGDCSDRDVLDEGTEAGDNGIDNRIWAKDREPGLYRLQLRPWSSQGFDGDYDGGIDVSEVTLLIPFPPLPATA